MNLRRDLRNISRDEASLGRSVSRVVAFAAAGLAVVVAAGVIFAFRYVASERARELDLLQARLGIVADSRVASVKDWLELNQAVLNELANNASLQLYVTELMFAEGDARQITDEPAQTSYLRNLLTATAERSGYTPPRAAAEIGANVKRVGETGIALADAKGRPIVATRDFPVNDAQLPDAIARALKGQGGLIDFHPGPGDLPTIGFSAPIPAVQAVGEGEFVGVAIGLRPAGDDLFRRLKQPGESLKTAEALLVRPRERLVEYLSPQADGTRPLGRSMALDTPDLDAAIAARAPGSFGIARDAGGVEVVAVSRAVPGTDWVLVYKAHRAEALAAAEARLRTLLTAMLVTIGAVGAGLVAVWRHGTSLRAAEAAARYRKVAEELSELSRFLEVVTDSQHAAILVMDAEGKISFANRAAAHWAGLDKADSVGKTLAAAFGPAWAEPLIEANRRALAEKRPVSAQRRMEVAGVERVLDVDHIPLGGEEVGRILMVLADVTEAVRQRERREALLGNVIAAVVGMVDRRDPYSAYHSARVAEVAHAVACQMAVSDVDIKTVDIAGRLMNLGKLYVPPELLTKTGQLSQNERDMLSRSFLTSAELLQGVEFEGPVVETIRQIGEFLDGAGPLGLKGDEILPTARIVAVANAFVGMVSPRAWREPMTFDKAAEILFEEAGHRFDRRPVLALMNILENQDGKRKWAAWRSCAAAPVRID